VRCEKPRHARLPARDELDREHFGFVERHALRIPDETVDDGAAIAQLEVEPDVIAPRLEHDFAQRCRHCALGGRGDVVDPRGKAFGDPRPAVVRGDDPAVLSSRTQ